MMAMDSNSANLERFNRLRARVFPAYRDGIRPGDLAAVAVGDDVDHLIKLLDTFSVSRSSCPGPLGGGEIHETVNLKQALRRMCILQASETAASRRLSKSGGMGGSSTRASGDGTVSARESSKIRIQDLSNHDADGRKVGKTAGSLKSPYAASPATPTIKITRIRDVVADDSSKECKGKTVAKISATNFKVAGDPKIRPPVGKRPSGETFPLAVPLPAPLNRAPQPVPLPTSTKPANSRSWEKGDSSQSSKSSSICDYSSSVSTSISEDSLGSVTAGSSSRPHMSKDEKWAAIRHALTEHGVLGLKNFRLLRKLGCGDIGTVYLAELIGSEHMFALKVMDVDYLIRRNKMARAQTERQILQMLDHPFLPTLYAHFAANNLSCLVMEYCPGGDLHVLRQRQIGRCFSELAARFYVAEVLLALEYLHMLGVIYRDLKPENILVREDGHIMLSDFDLSLRCSACPVLLRPSSAGFEDPGVGDFGRLSSAHHCPGNGCVDPRCLQPSCFTPRLRTPPAVKPPDPSNRLPLLVVEPTDARSDSFVGTHEYLAPEIIRGDGHGSSVDWWTLGIFLYELLFGGTPFKGPGNDETLANAVSRGLRFPESPAVSSAAKHLITGLLAKDPNSRLGSVRGAAEIKRHPFFDGLNWALIRCATVPEASSGAIAGVAPPKPRRRDGRCLEFSKIGEDVEFEIF